MRLGSGDAKPEHHANSLAQSNRHGQPLCDCHRFGHSDNTGHPAARNGHRDRNCGSHAYAHSDGRRDGFAADDGRAHLAACR